MPREATGSWYKSRERYYVSITFGPKARKSLSLPTCKTDEQASERAAIMNGLAQRLRAGAHAAMAPKLLAEVGKREGEALKKAIHAIERVCNGTAAPKQTLLQSATFRDVAEMWVTGALTRDYPDHVTERKDLARVRSSFVRDIYPLIGHVPIRDFTSDHGDLVLRSLPQEERGTRRGIAKNVARVLSLCVSPLKIITHSPLPRGWTPKKPPAKAKSHLYPDEEEKLLACRDIWLGWRVLYGFLHREGMRVSEAANLSWSDVDLDRGAIVLDKNKTDDPRAWAMWPGVAAVLRAWRAYREEREGPLDGKSFIFVTPTGKPLVNIDSNGASQLRDHLVDAGITRPQLFERSSNRLRLRVHDLRAGFITIALANGRTESWVSDRTGHRSSAQIQEYRRTARTFAELGRGDLKPLDEVLPDLAPWLSPTTPGAASRTSGAPSASPAAANEPALHQAEEQPARTLSALALDDLAPCLAATTTGAADARTSCAPSLVAEDATMTCDAEAPCSSAEDAHAEPVRHDCDGGFVGAIVGASAIERADEGAGEVQISDEFRALSDGGSSPTNQREGTPFGFPC